jgi:hypothetical protein
MRRITMVLVSLMVLLLALAGASSALAALECESEGCAPWWHLTAGARPTYLPAGTGAVQEQEIVTVPGEFGGKTEITNFSMKVGESSVGEFITEGLFGLPEPNAADLQKALEGAFAYGPGSVTVTEESVEREFGKGAVRYVIVGGGEKPPISVFGEEKTIATATLLKAGKDSGQINIVATNLGDAEVNAEQSPVTIADKLPSGVTAVGYETVADEISTEVRNPVTCELKTPGEPETVTCTFAGATELNGQIVPRVLHPYRPIEVRLDVVVAGGTPSGEHNDVTVSGGGAQRAVSVDRPLTVVSDPAERAPFGFENVEVTPEEPGGGADRQAGSHPFQTTVTLSLNQGPAFSSGLGNGGEVQVEPAGGLTKDVSTKLPPGLIGNPSPFPRCTLPQFQARACPADSVVGVANVLVNEPAVTGLKTNLVSPIFNLEPAVGEPARFGFLPTTETPQFIGSSILDGEDYAIVGEDHNILQVVGFLSAQLTFWGVPGDARHDNARSYECLEGRACSPLGAVKPPPFFALPTSCTGHPLEGVAEADSWEDPGVFKRATTSQFGAMPSLVGCEKLPFEPSVKVTPDTGAGSSPTGLSVDVHVPQAAVLNGSSLAQSNVRDITVALPAGVAINPAGGGGLEACSEGLVGFKGFREFDPGSEPEVSDPWFSAGIPGGDGSGETFQPGLNFCSDAAKIGTVEIVTPLLPPEQHLKGSVYLASQEQNPFGSLIAMYIVVEDPVSGAVVKLPGEVRLCQSTGETIDGMSCEGVGQIVTTFKENPQLAFEDAKLHFFGGERAPLASPARCGSYTTRAAFVPWAAEPSDEAALTIHSSSTFNITSGPHGGPCPGSTLAFHPGAAAGAKNLQAGEFTPFTLSMNRADGEQNLQSVTATLPPGLSGELSHVTLCPEPQANEGTCPESSLIGETTVSVGVGGDPFTVTGGRDYITGPYNGTSGCAVGQPGCAPFGLTFEVPAKAGPFDLAKTAKNHPNCDCVVVRGKIEIDPITSALTITSNPPGTPDAIPTVLEGIPLEIQHVNATTTRSDFQFNPTNCSKMQLIGTLHSSEGATDSLSEPFQVTNCAALKFEPKFAVSTSGKTSKANGASLTAKVTYPNVPQGTDADIAKVKVELPKQLPSRLTTLQKACTNKQFEANPAACPPESKIGYAVVHTPLIPVPLEGPAIFVSHGGEAFPSLTMVLQGYGITIDLVGTTFISKAGVTSTTFKTVPDQPFSSFQLTLPEGKYSALAAIGNLCTEKLTMPTEFVGQNGAKINETTKIAVAGCAKAKALTRAQKLAKALKACKKDRNKSKRQKCERTARKSYGPLKQKHKQNKNKKK